MKSLRATVCQLPEDPSRFDAAWKALASHTKRERSELVVLPEVPAAPWFAYPSRFDAALWKNALAAHDSLIARMGDLGAEAVLASRPVSAGARRLNQAFLWTPKAGYQRIRDKAVFPNEPGWYEAEWFHAGTKPVETAKVGSAVAGTLLCTELMFNEWSRAYGRGGAHLIAVPRASGSPQRWEIAGRMSAVASGAYVLSSNRFGDSAKDPEAKFGGHSYIIDPEGTVLGTTSEKEPFLTKELDLSLAEAAKKAYPRYIAEPRA